MGYREITVVLTRTPGRPEETPGVRDPSLVSSESRRPEDPSRRPRKESENRRPPEDQNVEGGWVEGRKDRRDERDRGQSGQTALGSPERTE